MSCDSAYVRDFVLAHRESDEPDAVLAILKAHDGKQLTKRLLAKLPGDTNLSGKPNSGEDRWRIRQVASMTSLEDRAYWSTQGNGGIHLLIAYQLTNVMIDAAWIEEHNPAYFKGRRERNASRDKIVNSSSMLALMADTLNAYAAAKAKLDEARNQLEALTGYGKPFAADQYDWERLCGAREDKK